MSWEPWSKADQKGLARYVVPSLGNRMRLDVNRDDLLRNGDRLGVANAIYRALVNLKLQYAREEYDPEAARQRIRDPLSMLDGAGNGTCLDLALLFAGLCAGNELLPLVVLVRGHAFVLVSATRGRREAAQLARTAEEGDWVKEGLLTDGAILTELVKSGSYFAVECTGFARTDTLPDRLPEGLGRQSGLLSFQRALEAGREQFEFAERPFLFAVDPVLLQDVKKFAPFESTPRGFENLPPNLRNRLGGIFAAHQLFGGRNHELASLDNFIRNNARGYFFVTGGSGSGKSALLANWIRTLEQRNEVHVACYFINQQHQLAGQDDTLRTLCQQLATAHGRRGALPNSLAELEALYVELLTQQPKDKPLIVIIDGLDEANGWEPGPRLFPHDLPEKTFVVFSARNTGRPWVQDMGLVNVAPPELEVGFLDTENIKDLLLKSGGNAAVWAERAGFVDLLRARSKGDPFYLQFLVQDLLQGKIQSPEELSEKAPAGLHGYLDNWWKELRATGALKEQPVIDLLSYLLVSHGRLTRSELVSISANDHLNSLTFDDAVSTVRRFVLGNDEQGFALCHPRLQDYLRQKMGEDIQGPSRDTLISWCADWQKHQSRYALAFYVSHILEQADLPGADRSALLGKILLALTDPQFQKARVEKIGDIPTVLREFNRAGFHAAALGSEITIPLVLRTALGAVHFRETWLRPERIFEAAARGDLDSVRRALDLFQVDGEWTQTAMLLAAWLARDANTPAAQAFVRHIADQLLARDPLPLLLKRVEASFGAPPPALVLPYPPGKLPPPDEFRAREALRQLGGSYDLHSSITGAEPLRVDAGDETPTYIAENDSPWLVSWAITNPPAGEAILRQYMSIHASNPYPDYRNRSLWGVLGAVLCHPDSRKAREFAKHLAIGALSPSPVRFREALPLTALALVALAGDAKAKSELASRRQQLQKHASVLRDGRGEGDNWGNFRRRLSAFAETTMILFGDTPSAVEALRLALSLPTGFAGYQAPASLTLAESSRMCREVQLRELAWNAAERAAHNVQDPGFCARTTARVNALIQRGRTPAMDLSVVLARFIKNPFAIEFAPVHTVQNPFIHRLRHTERVPIRELQEPASLSILAHQIFRLPVQSFVQMNPGYPVDQLIPPGTQIAVPDEKFAPLLACHFAAELIASSDQLPREQLLQFMRALVPIATPNPTALDTVLSRFLLAAKPTDANILSVLRDLAPAQWLEEPTASSAVALT